MTSVEDHVDDAIALLEVDRLEDAYAIRMCEGEPSAKDQCRERAQWALTFNCACEWFLCDTHKTESLEALAELLEIYRRRPDFALRHKPCGHTMRADHVHITPTHL